MAHWSDEKLIDAAREGHVPKLRDLLFLRGANIEVKDGDGHTPLHNAAEKGHVDAVRYLVEQRANIEAKNNVGWTPLHCAASTGSVDAVRYLVEKSANIHTTNDDGWTPLHDAAANGRVDAVRYLVEKGANIEAQDRDGKTAMDVAEDDATRAAMRDAAAQRMAAHAGEVINFLESLSLSQFRLALASEDVGVTCLDDLQYLTAADLERYVPAMSAVQRNKLLLHAAKNLPHKRARTADDGQGRVLNGWDVM